MKTTSAVNECIRNEALIDLHFALVFISKHLMLVELSMGFLINVLLKKYCNFFCNDNF